jgi:hypothetical protein
MPAPSSATYSAQAKIDAHTAFLALIDSGTAGAIKTYTNADALLCTHTLTDPAGTVSKRHGGVLHSLQQRWHGAFVDPCAARHGRSRGLRGVQFAGAGQRPAGRNPEFRDRVMLW